MASRSVKLNNLKNQVTVINDDLKNTTKYVKKDSVDVVTVNPPYFLNYETSEKNPNEYLAIARHELTTNLSQVVETAGKLLKMNGKFFYGASS
ncbi:tRNA (adenine37-N(6))-methyltransferase TrmN6 [Lentilactobacillus kosonis]|uniref:tRNA (Adenine37-N(6))-methyltransferase TrmN6 n=1 Tax=Lentilactobacillus kosonis TaxID=2810561 RepID=A0A401FLF4_9LACO|nr:tRNA (adenine37-N(6))-methyltransferase TrmN6 [Lentilactobacillus kosonis]